MVTLRQQWRLQMRPLIQIQVTLVLLVGLMALPAFAQDARQIVYTGGTEEQARAAALKLDLGEATFAPMSSFTFPGTNGLWQVGTEDAWDCTTMASDTDIATQIEQATDLFFAAEYEAARRLVDSALEHVACHPGEALVADALYLRGMIACMAEQTRADGSPIGSDTRAVDFFLYAHAANTRIAWNVEFPPTCRVANHYGTTEGEFDAKENFEFAHQAVLQARADSARWLPIARFGTEPVTVSGMRQDGRASSPSVHHVTWTFNGKERSRMVAVDANRALTLVTETAWSALLTSGPGADVASEAVLKESMANLADTVTVIVMNSGVPSLVYSVYPSAQVRPVVVHELPRVQAQMRVDTSRLPAGGIGASALLAIVGPGTYFGPSFVGRAHLVGGLHLHVEAALAFLKFEEYEFMLPVAMFGLRYHIGFKVVQPNIGVEAMVTFTNHPDRTPVLVGALGCGGISVKANDRVSPIVTLCGGYGMFGPASLLQAGVLFH